MRIQLNRRRGATLVEAALVYPVAFLLLLGLVVGAMGIFRFQQMASLSREAARYASVHGTQYAKAAGVTAPTPAEIYQVTVVQRSVGLDPSQLTYSITYDTTNDPYHINIVNGELVPVTNKVQVKLTYRWIPEALLGGVTMSSTSEMPMAY